jgi:hypothetical protein
MLTVKGKSERRERSDKKNSAQMKIKYEVAWRGSK